MNYKRLFVNGITYLVLTAAAVVSIFPFYWMLVGATNDSNSIAVGKMTFGGELLVNLNKLFQSANIVQILFNSFKISITTVVISLVITSMAAYGFEKFKTPTTEKIYTIFLVSMMIPFATLMIPLFKMMVGFKLINSHIAIILPTMASTFLIFFFRQYFKSFPNEILEAARMDGAKELYIFFRIVMPTMKSTYAAGAIYAFMTSWNSYLWPLVVLQTENKKTITLLLSKLSSFSYVADYGLMMMALVIATLPMMVIFLLMQRQFVEGILGPIKQ
jgi:lactose/L-arabinose transport system permease protein